MATFANQISNLSALTSALVAFSQILEVSEELDDRYEDVEQLHEQNAQLFLDSQRKRLEKIENQVLGATKCILPPKTECMSITEMAGLCRMVQESNRLQLEQLRRLLEATGCDVPWNESWEKKQPRLEDRKPRWTMIRRPLDRVSEGDVETEGATTPGSLLGSNSPFHASSSRKHSLTPTTPTMESLYFSASTSSILDSKTKSPLGYVIGRSPASSNNVRSNQKRMQSEEHFGDAFREEDDMITLDTHSTIAGLSLQDLQKRADALDEIINEDNHYEWRLPSALGEVDESIAESRPSDEANYSRSHILETSIAEQSTVGDDSTNVVATVVADGRQQQRNLNTSLSREFNRMPRTEQAFDNFSNAFKRPTHIVLDGAASSPAHTNITMDATMINDTMASLAINDEDDNFSTMTPVLDRYRLDPDDCSLGIKVVPNKRGQHRRDSLQSYQASFSIAETLDRSMEMNPGQRPLLATPMSLPANVSARKKKTFRKTPHPKKATSKTLTGFPEEENENPNLNSGSRISFSSPKLRSPLTSISVPPLRSSSLEPTNTFPSRSSTSRPRSLPISSLAFTPVASREIQDDNFTRLPSRDAREGKWMEKITMAEYEVAPPVVKQQVSRDEVNDASGLLEQFLTSRFSDSQTALEFTEQEAYHALKGYLVTEQKSRSVLLSLCHWRRLLMHRDDAHGMRFVVNQFEQ